MKFYGQANSPRCARLPRGSAGVPMSAYRAARRAKNKAQRQARRNNRKEPK